MMEAIAKNRTSTTYDSYKDSRAIWLGKIPDHWKLTRLGTQFEERRTKVSDKDYPPLSVTKNGTVPQLENAAKTNDGDNRKLVKKGDFVINSRSDRKGSSGIAFQDGSVSLINIVIQPKGIHPIYCNYLLKSHNFIEEFYRMGHGIVADLWTTRYDEMKAITIGVPPLHEQTAIADFLDEKTEKIDRAIAQKERLIELLKERKQILIQNAVTKGLNSSIKLKDSGVEWIGEIPEHWEVKRLRFLGRTQNGISAGADFFGEGHPFVSYSDVYNNPTIPLNIKGLARSNQEEQQAYSVKKGDVFFTRTSETADDIGVSSVCHRTIEKATFAGFLIRFRPKASVLYSRFSQYYFRSGINKGFIEKEMNLVTRASLSQSLLNDMPVLLPPINKQKEIASELDRVEGIINHSITRENEMVQKLKEYKSTLIDSAVTGKIKVC